MSTAALADDAPCWTRAIASLIASVSNGDMPMIAGPR